MNRLHGVCQQCRSQVPALPEVRDQDICQRCRVNTPDFLDKGVAICSKCYLSETSPKKAEIMKPKPVGDSMKPSNASVASFSKSFFHGGGKMQKKIEGLFEKHKSWNYELLTYLNMNALCSNPLTWDRIIQKCNKKGCLLYLFVTKTHILGCFHAEPCKISDKVTIQDSECGYFITDRNQFLLKFYKPRNDKVCYHSQEKTISFGMPCSFGMVFAPELSLKTEIINAASVLVYYCVIKL